MKASLSLSIAIVLLAVSLNLSAQEKQEDSSQKILYKEIAHQDSLLFDAFNKRDTATFSSFFSTNLEFFHDKGGLTGYQHTINFLNQLSNSSSDLRRDLIKRSLEVYPIPGYGATEIGSHTFCHTENNKLECGTFRFVNIWQLQNDKWKITRVVSYGH